MSARYTGGLVYNAPGGWSGFFPSNSSLTFGYTSGIALGSTYTIECWINPTSASQGYLFEMAQSNTGGFSYLVFYISSGQVGSAVRPSTSGTEYYSSAGTITAGVWQHVAVVNTAGTAQLYVNGFAVGSTYSMPALSTIPVFCAIGQRANGFSPSGTYYNGYISNLRITTSAVYTSNFTPPSGQLQAIANTKLLTCAYPTFVDGSTNAYALTSSSATVNTLNPFPTSQLPNPALGGAGNGVYTMSQYAALKAANLWPAYDPYYRNVTLNLHGNARTVLPFNTDASTNNFQVTQVGDTRPSNWTPFAGTGYYSNYFDGSGDYLTTASNTALQAGTGAFTLEGWIYITGTTSGSILSQIPDVTGGYGVGIAYAAGSNTLLGVITTTSTNAWNASITPVKNTWYHVALVRDASTNIALFINGTKITPTVGGSTNTTNITTSTNFVSGAYYYDNPTRATYQLGGYVSNARFVKGTAVYDPTASSITVPTTPLTAVSGTSLLTCQSNRFVDNSTNAFAITVSGNTSVDPYQPFTAPTGTSAYGSGYFDGSGDYLRAPTGYLTGVTTGNFTVEGWWNFGDFTVRTTYFQRLWSFGTGLANDVTLNVDTSGNLVFRVNDSIIVSQSSGAMKLNSWNHVALVRSSGTVTIYLNGTSVASAANSSNISGQAGNPFYLGCESDGAGGYFYGYCSNVRITNTAVYTTTFTPSTTPLTAVSGTSLLTLQTNAPSQNNTFLDSSTNNFVITRNGNTTQGTFTPYGSNWSLANPNTSDTGIGVATNAVLNLGTANFTIECWINLNALPTSDSWITSAGGYQALFATGPNSSATGSQLYIGTTNIKFDVVSDGSGPINVAHGMTAGVWYHIALTRSGSTISLYKNGVLLQSGTDSNSMPSGYGWGIARAEPLTYFSGGWLNGYMSNFRLVSGSVVYTSAFTPPTAPLTAISGTQLLLCQSNRWIDNSSNNFTVGTGGNVPSVQRFSPFSPTTAYSTSVIGGSGYFDGSGDYLNLTSNASLGLGTGTYTAECWVYASAAPAYSVFFEVDVSGLQFGVNASANIAIAQQNVAFTVSSSTPVPLNAWSHIAVSRDGSNVTRIYLNGVQIASATDTTNYATGTTAYINNNTGNSNKITGYIADLRVLKGTALYTSAFTPPTAPLTAITNTSLLLSYTNAGILDNAMMNDLETVGNAQISTSVKKYGSGSISMTSSGDYLKGTQPSVVYDINGGDFTIEFWVNFTSLAADRALVSKYGNTAENAGGLGYVVQWVQSSSVLRLVLGVGGGSDALYTWSWSPSTSTWYHVAITRSGTSGRAFVNGTQIGTTSTLSTSDVASPNVIQLGKTHTVAQYLLGYMDDVRITKGVARYTANFTPPTSQVQDQ